MNETQSESLPKPVENTQPSGIARRRLLRAGLAAGPVVLALSGRSAMACTTTGGDCDGGTGALSCAAWESLAANPQTSAKPARHSLGEKPERFTPKCANGVYTFPRPWPAGCKPFASKRNRSYVKFTHDQMTSSHSMEDRDYDQDKLDGGGWSSGTKCRDTGVLPDTVFGDKTVSQCLLTGTEKEKALCTAYLNAIDASINYCMNTTDVRRLATDRRLVPGGRELSDADIIAYCKQTWGQL